MIFNIKPSYNGNNQYQVQFSSKFQETNTSDYIIKMCMAKRKNWTSQEDSIIKKLASENEGRSQHEKLKWGDIADILNESMTNCKRTGKQCRQRWHNQLHPDIKESQFGKAQIEQLFNLQNKFGNKWAAIARQLPGRTDNQIKNFFYSSLRRALRQINLFVSQYKKKSNIKPFKPIIITKILTVNDEKYRSKLDIKNKRAMQIAQQLKMMLGDLSQRHDENFDQQELGFREKIVQNLQEFNKCCKKKKEKKKTQENEEQIEQHQFQMDQESVSQAAISLNKNKHKTLNFQDKVSVNQASQVFKNIELNNLQKAEDPKRPNFHKQSSFLSNFDNSFNRENQQIYYPDLEEQQMLKKSYNMDKMHKKDSFNDLFNCDANPTMFASLNIGQQLAKVNADNEIAESGFISNL